MNADRMIGGYTIACEILIAAGPRNLYGLLGGEFKPKNIPQLEIHIGSFQGNERLFDGSIASKADKATIGLPVEYVPGIIEGFKLGRQKLINVGQGDFTINRGVYGIIGSSEVLFKHLTSILFCLLHLNGNEMSDKQILGLLPDRFS